MHLRPTIRTTPLEVGFERVAGGPPTPTPDLEVRPITLIDGFQTVLLSITQQKGKVWAEKWRDP